MTIRLDDMRLFAAVASAESFTAAARALGVPKQTVSRRVAVLERELGVRLIHRTTRTMRLTEPGAAYAARCAELVRLADDANDALTQARDRVIGTLRVTADPLFGEAFLADLAHRYLRAHPEVRVEILLTQRRVDLVEEGFDVAFRVGEPEDGPLVAHRLGPAAMRYCASPSYLRRRGRPTSPDDLEGHDTIVLAPENGPPRWLFVIDGAPAWRPARGRVRVNHLPAARRLALCGAGIANLPAFACDEDVARGDLAVVLDTFTAPFGTVSLVHPERRLLAARVRAFVELAVATFGDGAVLRGAGRARRRGR